MPVETKTRFVNLRTRKWIHPETGAEVFFPELPEDYRSLITEAVMVYTGDNCVRRFVSAEETAAS